MAVKIRLKRMGKKRSASYRLVVSDSSNAPIGRFVEELGYYDPTTEPATYKIDEEKALKWLNNGAKPSNTVKSLMKKSGIYKKFLNQKE
ncbi:MAG: 30S ribosomal protein S16 [Halanaerobiales bacterium]|nr:30S ribosomal protein S16 [Halanaerobiales bacterium]